MIKTGMLSANSQKHHHFCKNSKILLALPQFKCCGGESRLSGILKSLLTYFKNQNIE
jgi:hypothetical protein